MKNWITSIILAASAFTIHAQSDTNLREVVVTSTRSETTFDKTARNVTVLDKKEIQSLPVQTLPELLEYAANIDVRQRGQNGVQADISMRGAGFEQTLILLNGIKMTDPQTGHNTMSLPVEIMDIERIEILHGGASRIYGPNAFAGAINIITKNPTENRVYAKLVGGDYGFNEEAAAVTLAMGKHSHTLSFQRRASAGYIRNTDFEMTNIFWQSELHLKNSNWYFNLGQNDKAYGSQDFYTAKYPWQYSAGKTQFTSVSGEIKQGIFTITPKAYYRRRTGRYELYREGDGYYYRTPNGSFTNTEGDTISWYTGHNYHKTQVYGAELNVSMKTKLGVTSVGYDHRYEGIISSKLGEDMETPEAVPNEVPSAFYTQELNRENNSWYIEHNLSLGNLFVSAGAMYNVNTAFGEQWLPGIDVSYGVNNNIRPYTSVNKSFRLPSFTDLYYNVGGAMGSKNLQQEESINYEGGVKFNTKTGNGHVAYFRREGDNLIDWVYFAPDSLVAANITELNINGIEADYVWNTSGLFNGKSPLKSVRASYTYMWADSMDNTLESNYVMDFLQHKGDISLHFEVVKNVFVDWSFSYQDRLGNYQSVDGEFHSYNPVVISDLRIQPQIGKLKLFVEASNLFDQKYNDIGNVKQPGRWIKAGLSINLNYKTPQL